MSWTLEEQAEHRRLWVEALRSGKYPQTREGLCRIKDGKESYCCLGVACEVAIENGVSITKRPDSAVPWTLYNDSCGWLPEEVKDWLGLTHRSAEMNVEPGFLATANDDLNWDFYKIADAIEAGQVEVVRVR